MSGIEDSGDRGAVAPAGTRQGPLTPLTPDAHPNGKSAVTATPAGAARDTTAGTAPLARLRGFHPGWFGAVMGTAIVGVAAAMNPGQIASLAPAARTLGQAMAVLATALAVVLAVPYLGRFVLHRDAALADLRDPVAGALYGTLPGGILVLAATAAAVGPTLLPAPTVRELVASLDWVGVPLAFAISVVFAYLLFVRSELVLETVNGGWFIPPVVNIVVPLVLVPLVPGSSPATARALLLASYAFWGMGFLLYLLIVTMLHHRLVLHPLPHAGLAPSLWIGLGPIGVGALALVKMAAAGTAVLGRSGRPSRSRPGSPRRRCGASGCGGWPPRRSCSCTTCNRARSPMASAGGASPSPSAPTPSPRSPWPGPGA